MISTPRYVNYLLYPGRHCSGGGSLPGVFVLNEDNKRELRLIRIGDDVGVDGVAVLSGLRAGERVVVKGQGADASNSSWR